MDEPEADGRHDSGPDNPDAGILDRSNAVRAAVFGVQDGMVSNIGLIMGVIGARVPPGTVVIAGVAGLASGAISMGAGEYIGVRTQREMLEAGHRGTDDELVSPWRAMGSSSVSFSIGAMVPLLAFFFTEGGAAVAVGAALSASALFVIGAAITKFTDGRVWWSATRMVLIGGTAGMLGYALGNAAGVVLG